MEHTAEDDEKFRTNRVQIIFSQAHQINNNSCYQVNYYLPLSSDL